MVRRHGAERIGAQRAPAPAHLLEVTAYISGHCLHLTWTYSREAHSDETIAALAAQCLDELRAVITQSCNMEGRYTPADFPLAALSPTATGQAREHAEKRKAAKLTPACALRACIKKAVIEDIYPLSPTQQGMLIHAWRLLAPARTSSR